jgi:glycosyltransferase involved in cell wall biosynthesis
VTAVLVTVVVPTFDVADALPRSVETALLQRSDAVDVEVLVVDGGSTDGTVDVASAYTAAGHRVVVDQAPDRSVYDAMDRALPIARGAFVHYLGAGDTLRPGAFDALLAGGLPPDGRELVVYGDVWLAAAQRFTHGPFDGARFAARFGICHQAILWDRRTVARLGGYGLRHRIHADHVLTMRAFGDPGVEARYVPVVVANFEGGGLSDTRVDPATALDFPSIVRDSFGIDIPTHAWGDLVWPPAAEARVHDEFELGAAAYLDGAWAMVALETDEALGRAWVAAPDGFDDGELRMDERGRPVVRAWIGSWPPGTYRVRVDAMTPDGRRSTAFTDVSTDGAQVGAAREHALTRPTSKLVGTAESELGRVAVVVVRLGSDGSDRGTIDDGGVVRAVLDVAALDASVVERVDEIIARAGRARALVVLVDQGTVLAPYALRELAAEHLTGHERCLIFGDEVGGDVVLKPGWSTAHALAQDIAGPVTGVDVDTLRLAVATGSTPLRTVGAVAATLADQPLEARRVPRVLARRTGTDASCLAEAALAVAERRGHGGATSSVLRGVSPPAHDLRWRPRAAGHVSLVATISVGDPPALDRLAALLATATAVWPSVELVVVDSSPHGIGGPPGAVVVRGPRSGAAAVATNVGVEAAMGDTIVLVDEWTAPLSADWLTTLLMHLDDPWVAVAGAVVLDPDLRRVRCGGLWLHPEVGPVRVLGPVYEEL